MEFIYQYLVDNDLDYIASDFDEFSSELDFAILNGDIINIPEFDREEAFDLATQELQLLQNIDYDDSMDGDHDSNMRDIGWGTDEDYGYYGESVFKDADYVIKMLKESLASKKAKKAGLVHIGFGNYAKEPGSPAEYKTVDGKLKKVGGIKKKKSKEAPKQTAPKKEEPKKEKEKPKAGIRNLRRVSGEKFTYEFEKDGRKYKFTLNKQERKELKGEGSIMDIVKKRMKKKTEKEKTKQFKKGKHVSSDKK